MSFKYVFKSLAGDSLRYKVFHESKMIVLRCRMLAKLGRPETSASPFIAYTNTDSQTTPSSKLRNQDQETFFSPFC